MCHLHGTINNLFEFDETDTLPTAFKKRLDTLSSPDECSELLINQKTGLHESFVSIYYKQKLERKRESYEKQSTENEGPRRKMTRLIATPKIFSEHSFLL